MNYLLKMMCFFYTDIIFTSASPITPRKLDCLRSADLQNRHKQLESVLYVRNAVRTLWRKQKPRTTDRGVSCARDTNQTQNTRTPTSRNVLVIKSLRFVSCVSMALSWRPKRDAMPPKCQHTVLTNLPAKRDYTVHIWYAICVGT